MRRIVPPKNWFQHLLAMRMAELDKAGWTPAGRPVD